jgi:hypothetical protein
MHHDMLLYKCFIILKPTLLQPRWGAPDGKEGNRRNSGKGSIIVAIMQSLTRRALYQ